jgi:23S rRNA pseudouridine1911/1915/1917 synthase
MSHSPAGNRIFHHVTAEKTTVLACLEKHFRVDRSRAEELLSLGAIYSDKRRVLADRPLEKGTYLRLHLQPKRFPVTSVRWDEVIIADEREYLVVLKPAGIPVHATVDNRQENLLEQLRGRLRRSLLVTQRLDIAVAGLMAVAKTSEFQRRFNQSLSDRKVHKRYRALLAVAPPLGRQIHYMEPSERSPRRVSAERLPGWQQCELTIHTVHPHGLFHDAEIELHTGRTHQIRAQMAALGCPVVGDRLYGSTAECPQWGSAGECIGLFSVYLAWAEPGHAVREFSATPPWNRSKN